MPTTHSIAPTLNTALKCPTSDADPDQSGTSMRKNSMSEPIQEIFEGEEIPLAV